MLGRGRDVKRERPVADVGEIKAFLGEGTEFKGILNFEGTIRVDGYLEGEIVGDDLLIVGEPGLIRARIEVGTIVVSGRIEGNIEAKKRVELLASSLMIGNIKAPSLVVAEGATFNGSCEMARQVSAVGPEAGPDPPDRA